MGKLPDEAYIALAALKEHGWFMLAQGAEPGEREQGGVTLAEGEGQMRACEPWTSLILDEWAQGNGNRMVADAAWLESTFDAPGDGIGSVLDSGDR